MEEDLRYEVVKYVGDSRRVVYTTFDLQEAVERQRTWETSHDKTPGTSVKIFLLNITRHELA